MKFTGLTSKVLGRVDEQFVGSLLSNKFHQLQVGWMAKLAMKSHHRPPGLSRLAGTKSLKGSTFSFRRCLSSFSRARSRRVSRSCRSSSANSCSEGSPYI